MNIVLLGIQGSGKGSLVLNIQSVMDITLISTGQLLRDEVATGSPLGKHINEMQVSGRLVELNTVMRVIDNKLHSKTKDTVIFDGFPRNIEQLRALDKVCNVDKVIYLKLSKEVAIDRIVNRLTCKDCGYITSKLMYNSDICPNCGGKLVMRSDDTIEGVNIRFKVYEDETLPLVEVYRKRGILYEIDASRTMEEIFESVMKVIK